MSPIQIYHKRYLELKEEKGVAPDAEVLLKLIESDSAGLNNYFMAALGMSTLILRLGAVIQMCQKFEALDEHGDALFMKQVLENLRESLPNDTSWKNLWIISAKAEEWLAPTVKPKKAEALIDRFITCRNHYVHQQLRLEVGFVSQIQAAIVMFDEMADLLHLFKDGELVILEGKFYWRQHGKKLLLYPFVQPGEGNIDPYVFQGLYDSKTQAYLLNLRFGDEAKQDSLTHLEPAFKPIKDAIKGGAGQVFEHRERIAYYQSCFVGRDVEKQSVIDFCRKSDEQNILCIKSPAGMGKGALLAEVIEHLKKDKNQVLYHFCGAGMQNSLHATLYHLIIQGDRAQYWNTSEEHIKRKLQRLPSKYVDVIHLFQSLLDEQLKIQKNNESGNLVVLIDGLDEAQVAYSQLNISDWFYTYNDKEEPEADWRSKSNIRWIFTYRCTDNGDELFYRFPSFKQLATIECVQPLKGLQSESVDAAFKEFAVSDDFKADVIKKATILD